MEIITNSKNKNHATALSDLIEWAESCYFCTSFFDKSGLELLLPALREAIKQRGLTALIYSNGEQGYTKPCVIKKLSNIEGISHRIVKQKGRRLHSKLYLFTKKHEFVAILGSANLTGNGLQLNEELSVKTSGVIGSSEFTELQNYFEKLSLLESA